MKRLIKKASVTLYHGTKSDKLRKIYQDGFIKPDPKRDSFNNGYTKGMIFLSNKGTAEYYATNYFNNNDIKYDYTIFGVVLELQVDESELSFSPQVMSEEDVQEDSPAWEQSMEDGECVYIGDIPVNCVLTVTFKRGYNDSSMISAEMLNYFTIEEVMTEVNKNIKFDTPISLSQAISQLDNLKRALDSLNEG